MSPSNEIDCTFDLSTSEDLLTHKEPKCCVDADASRGTANHEKGHFLGWSPT